MKCNKCSFENNNESKFCINCGNELVSNNQYIQDEATINKQKKSCKVIGIIGLVLSLFINILSLPFNIIAIVKGSKIKKQTGKTETGFTLGIVGIVIGIILFLISILIFMVVSVAIDTTKEKLNDTMNEITSINDDVEEIENDIIEQNKAYFDYSLGEYTYDYEKYLTDCFLYKCSSKARKYTIKYIDGSEVRNLEISNAFELEEQLSSAINELVREDFEPYKYEITTKIENSNLNDYLYDITIATDKINEKIDYSNPVNGVVLRGLNIRNLKKNNLKARIQFYFHLNHELSKYTNIKSDIINSISNTFNYFENDNCSIIVYITDNYGTTEQSSKTVYELVISSNGYELMEK